MIEMKIIGKNQISRLLMFGFWCSVKFVAIMKTTLFVAYL